MTTILWIICLISFGIVVAFWLWFAIASHKLTAYPSSNEKPGVSVIVVHKNEGKNIINLIERALAQNYPNFEVIAIDDFSTDDGSAQLSKIQDSRLHLAKAIKDLPGKKEALKQAINMAKNPYLLFTDGDCMPSSTNWIQRMVDSVFIEPKADIVCGYGPLKTDETMLGKWQRYETWLTAVQYMTYAFSNIPYMAVGRNMLVEKESFIASGGFRSNAHLASGDDDMTVQSIFSQGGKVRPCVDQDAWVFSEGKTSLTAYYRQKTRHISTSYHYSMTHKLYLGIFAFSQMVLWVTILILLFKVFSWWIIILVVVKWVIQMICHLRWMQFLGHTSVSNIFPILDVISPLYYMSLWIYSWFGRREWK